LLPGANVCVAARLAIDILYSYGYNDGIGVIGRFKLLSCKCKNGGMFFGPWGLSSSRSKGPKDWWGSREGVSKTPPTSFHQGLQQSPRKFAFWSMEFQKLCQNGQTMVLFTADCSITWRLKCYTRSSESKDAIGPSVIVCLQPCCV